MNCVKFLASKNPCLEEIAKIVPASCKHTLVDELRGGMQPPDTYIVGIVEDAYPRIVWEGKVKKRMTLREVLLDGSKGLQLDVFGYGTHADTIHDYIQEGKSNGTIWMAFAKTRLVKYRGPVQNGWCELSLRAGNRVAADAEVWIVAKPETVSLNAALPSSSKSKTQTAASCHAGPSGRNKRKQPEHFTVVCHCNSSRKVTVCAVVKEILKTPEPTKFGTFHLMMAVFDPSCCVDMPIRDDLPIHVFFNDTSIRDLPGGVSIGDILLLRNISLEPYKDKIHGTVYDPKQIIKFSSDPEVPIEAITLKPRYEIPVPHTRPDEVREKVISLRDWWGVQKDMLMPATNTNADGAELLSSCDDTPDLQIKEILEVMAFTLCCQVMETYRVKATNRECLFKVQDGTMTQICFKEYRGHDATTEGITQTEYYTNPGSLMVDVLVKNACSAAESIVAKDVIQMKNVKCLKAARNGEDMTVDKHVLILDCNDGEMVKLPSVNIVAAKIIDRVKKAAVGRGDNSVSSDSTMVPTPAWPTPAKPSPNRISSQPFSPNQMTGDPRSIFLMPLHHNRSQKPQDMTANSHTSRLSGKANEIDNNMETENSEIPSDVTSNTQSSFQPLAQPAVTGDDHSGNVGIPTSDSGCSGEKSGVVLKPSTMPCSTKIRVPTSKNIPLRKKQPVKRKLNMETPSTSAGHTTVTPNIKKIITVVDEGFVDITFSSLLARSACGTLYRVYAYITELFSLTSRVCTRCNNGCFCIHLWVWGLCEACGVCTEGAALQRLYSKNDLLTRRTLHCHVCRTHSSNGRINPQGKPSTSTAEYQGTVSPIVRLVLCLRDPETGFIGRFNVSADSAERLLGGVTPKFSWIIQETEAQLRELLAAILSVQDRLHFGIKKTRTSQGTPQYLVSNTSLLLIDA
ncbi:uncharacterized protein [Cherax quadricarinatus]|uniref:uncharacterized protein isoform X9 n=1 Tax=Cherax quadricarinatus TaxID=27406 RepID=UPI00387EC4FA